MFPSITRGTGRGLIPKSEPSHSHQQPHGLTYIEKKHFEHRPEEQLKGVRSLIALVNICTVQISELLLQECTLIYPEQKYLIHYTKST